MKLAEIYNSLESTHNLSKKKHLFYYLSIIALFFPIYNTPNFGGTGLAITYNIPAWTIVSWGIAAGFFLVAHNKQLKLPLLWMYFIIFPIIVIFSSLLAVIDQPIAWLFRVLYILGGLFFLFSLFQFNITQRTLDRSIFIIIVATGLHSLLGSFQIFAPQLLSPWFPQQTDFTPRSLFQQINVHASFLVTGLILTLYFISRPSFRYSSLLVKAVVVISFSLAIFIIASSGSRVGFLSAILGIPLVLWSRYQPLRPHKKLLIILLITSCIALFSGQAGLQKTADKMAQLKENSYSTARITMYTIGLELVKKQPVHGYGIGGFLNAWNKQASDFINRHPEASLPDYIYHPHNELLYWMIEGGLLATSGILVIITGIAIALYHCGFQRGGAYAAMLIPISLHTQVEHPFYISAVLWFLWLFLIFIVLKHQTKTINITLSLAATRLIQCVAILLAIGATTFMINTMRAQTDLYNYINLHQRKPPFLQVALNNIYFQTLAEEYAMHTMMHISIKHKDTDKVKLFEKWAQKQVKVNPKLQLYQSLVSASRYLRPEEKGCDALKAALSMHAQHKPFQSAYLDCS